MIKILANDGIHPDGKMLLEEAGFLVETNRVTQVKLPEVLPKYDAIFVRSATTVRKDLIDKCPNLKLIARGGVGLDNIDVEYAKSKGITVINTPNSSSQSVAELVFAHLFTLSRFLHHANREMPAKGHKNFKNLKKQYSKGTQLRGKTLGVIGFGRIGIETIRLALGIGMNVLPVDPYVEEVSVDINTYKSSDIRLSVRVNSVTMDEMLAKADFITLHVPFLGKPVIGKEEIAKMKDGVFLINCARGGVVDEKALLDGLNSEKIAGAGIDVFEDEPMPNTDLLKHPNVSATPHIGGSTLEAQRNIGLELADRVIAHYGL